MKKIYYFLFSILAVATTSCSDDLDIKPTSFISDATVWEDQALINKYVSNKQTGILKMKIKSK